jgi:cell division protein FtsW
MSTRSFTRREQYSGYLRRIDAPYYLMVWSLFFLSAIGIVMVLSASSIVSLQQSGTTYSIFIRQLLFFGVSILALVIIANWRVTVWDWVIKYSLLISGVMLCLPLVPGIGLNVHGNTNWIHLGGFTMQPSEFAKLGLILWSAAQLRKYDQSVVDRSSIRQIAFLLPGTLIVVFLILMGHDLGATVVVLGIIAALLFVSGLPVRHFLVLGSVAIVGLAGMVALAPYRIHRLAAVINPFAPDIYKLAGWQPAHSVMGLASGGLFGVGLGASRQKWGNLSEAHTDFIFSVIGEELGLLGTLLVLIFYAALLYGIYRTAIHAKDLLSRYACAGIATWFLIQIFINIGSNIGVLPVVGVTLPFISYGGSSLMANFLAIGYVLNVARRDPELRRVMNNRKKLLFRK